MLTTHNKSMDDLNERINQKIELLAYQKTESRGLDSKGHEVEDWLEAEEEVLSSLRAG